MKNRNILKYHSYAGLLVGVFLVLMGISGAILVFQHDIEDLQWQEHIQVENFESLEIDRGISEIQKHYPEWDTRLIHFQENEALIFNLRKPAERLFVFVHPTSGEIIKEVNELTTFTRWLLRFHYSFQAGAAGRIAVFVVGILFLFSLLSGLYIYRKSILKTLLFKTSVNKKSVRTYYSSLHRIVGVWALIFNLLLVVTGLFLAWKVAKAGLNPPAAPETPVVTAPVGDILQKIEEENPDFDPTYVRLPLTEEATLTVFGVYEDDPFYYSEFGNYFLADYRNGEIFGAAKITEQDFSTKFMNTLIPLHFGQYGGIWTKILYCLIGFSGPFLSISGFIIWKKGNSKKKSISGKREKKGTKSKIIR